MIQYLRYVGAAFAFAAAILWLRSASIKTPTSLMVSTETVESGYDGSTAAFSSSEDLENLGKALKAQGRWSAWAAACAAVAAALEGLALFLGPCSN
jgi:hypothetical protein